MTHPSLPQLKALLCAYVSYCAVCIRVPGLVYRSSVYHTVLLVPWLLLLQVAKAVEDIMYAATQEEGEAHLAAAIAELELQDDAEQEQVGVICVNCAHCIPSAHVVCVAMDAKASGGQQPLQSYRCGTKQRGSRWGWQQQHS